MIVFLGYTDLWTFVDHDADPEHNGTDDASCDGPELAMTSPGGRLVLGENRG